MPALTRVAVVTTAACLVVIAGLHLAWAFGFPWPAGDSTALARAVLGATDGGGLPPAPLTAAVAVALTGAALLLLARIDALGGSVRTLLTKDVPRRLVTLGCALLCAGLFLRGLGGFAKHALGALDDRAHEYVVLDLRVYSPLCVLLALGALLALRNQPTRAT
ncbi:DUF3995 domain-containing protein [Streptoalloteichus hindustanus]|uniref:DUF3995 domain-containing protein n=1 Tax=Streptoalloteichus hindustanus TaxID=2017 RepID=A0A1M4YTL2_STRHI|nr:DUF3995 domain-containing protein [Streptoalloteichus hindustanus]SHF09053.1 Protein of unknown function [Streptoalloteichus hindustanus]